MAIATSIPPKPGWIIPQIDAQSPFAVGLAFVLWMNESAGGVVEALSNVVLAPGSASARTKSPYGSAVAINNSGNSGYTPAGFFTPLITSTKDGQGDYTLLQIANPASAATAAYQTVLQLGSTNQTFMGFNSTNAFVASAGLAQFGQFDGSNTSSVTIPSATDGNYHVYVGRRSVAGATATNALFLDGNKPANTASGTAVVDIMQAGSAQLAIQDQAAGLAYNIAFSCGWNRALSDLEIQIFSAQLWGAWQRPSRWWLRAPVVAGGPPQRSLIGVGQMVGWTPDLVAAPLAWIIKRRALLMRRRSLIGHNGGPPLE